MFCRHCGNQIKGINRYCTKCGSALTEKERRKTAINLTFSVPFMLVILVAAMPILGSFLEFVVNQHLLRNKGPEGIYVAQLQAPYQISQWTLSKLVPGVIGIMVLIGFAVFGIIDVQVIKYREIVLTLALNILCVEIGGQYAGSIIGHLGADASATFSVYRWVYNSFAIPELYRWFLLSIYLLTLSGRIKSYKWIAGVTCSVLVIWSIILRSSPNVLVVTDLVYPTIEILIRTFSNTMWLNRIVLLGFVLIAGNKMIKTIGIIGCTLFKVFMAAMIMAPFVFNLQLAWVGLPLAQTLAYIAMGSLYLIIVALKKKRSLEVFT